MKDLFYKTARYIYRCLNLSVNTIYKNKEFPNVISIEAGNDFISMKIIQGTAKMISRFGTPESNALLNYLQIEERKNKHPIIRLNAQLKGFKDYWDNDVKKALSDLVGVFPINNDNLEKFSNYYIRQIKNIDYIGIWGFVPGETYLVNRFCHQAIKYNPISLEPYFFNNPWSASLKGKKVLVIHPFINSIESQYQRRNLIFENQNILPEFSLKTIRAVQSIAGNKTPYNNWFEALEAMQKEIDNCDFDVALIGAGSYGLPLASYVKQKNKIAIHMGGSLQILFGIKGKRWDEHETISKLYNAHWIRPSEEEMVPDAKKVEGGCYW